MKTIILSLALFVVCAHSASVSVGSEKDAPIISQESEVSFDGSYHHSFETGNGISAQEQGVLKNPGVKDAEAEEVQGGFRYTAPDGTPISIQYVANEHGFQPQGDHLPVAPTPPPIPKAILRALDWIAAHPQPQEPTKKF